MEHELKILPEYFEASISNRKRFELRKNNRNFCVGDVLVLREWNGEEYTGRVAEYNVDYILERFDGLDPNYVIMSISPIH